VRERRHRRLDAFPAIECGSLPVICLAHGPVKVRGARSRLPPTL
jgi:hypothetical protein